MICHRVVVCPRRMQSPTDPRPDRHHRRRGLRRRLRGRLPGLGRLAARRRVRARRGRRGVRRAPADRRGPPPPRCLRRRHPTHRGAADPHRPRRRGEHGPGGKLGGGGGARRWGRTGPLRPSDDGARRRLHGRPARPVLDGPLHGIRHRLGLPVIGYVKTHHRRMLARDHWVRVPELTAGERSGLFAAGRSPAEAAEPGGRLPTLSSLVAQSHELRGFAEGSCWPPRRGPVRSLAEASKTACSASRGRKPPCRTGPLTWSPDLYRADARGAAGRTPGADPSGTAKRLVLYQFALVIQSSGSNLAEPSPGPPRPSPTRGTAPQAPRSSESATGASRGQLRRPASS